MKKMSVKNWRCHLQTSHIDGFHEIGQHFSEIFSLFYTAPNSSSTQITWRNLKEFFMQSIEVTNLNRHSN